MGVSKFCGQCARHWLKQLTQVRSIHHSQSYLHLSGIAEVGFITTLRKKGFIEIKKFSKLKLFWIIKILVPYILQRKTMNLCITSPSVCMIGSARSFKFTFLWGCWHPSPTSPCTNIQQSTYYLHCYIVSPSDPNIEFWI